MALLGTSFDKLRTNGVKSGDNGLRHGHDQLSARIERWPVRGAFTISRGAKTHVDVVVAEIVRDGVTGRGEATAIYYHGETAESVRAAIAAMSPAITRADLQTALPRGAARNALDCALWDWEAKRTGRPAWALAGLPAPRPRTHPPSPSRSATPIAWRPTRAPRRTCPSSSSSSPARATRRASPPCAGVRRARGLIVDANEAWTGRDIAAEAARLLPFGVELIEQPVKAGEDHLLDGVTSPIPLCADESCQDRADLPRLAGRYQAINIKLDKCGGLTEALALANEASALGLELMVGCMLGTSLGMAPAHLVAQQARWVDLDGALLLAEDRKHGMQENGGQLSPPAAELWG